MSRTVLLVCAALLAGGCASHGGYRHVESVGGAGDYYYDGVGYRAVDSGCPGFSTFDYYPYHALFWGLRSHYYAPVYAPGFHYGVTWFPCDWFAYPTGHRYSWSYLAYSPWRYSFWDAYFFWHQPRPPPVRGVRGSVPRFGSARNEAERVARLRAAAAAKTYADGRARALQRPTARSRAGVRSVESRGTAVRQPAAVSPRSPSRAPSTLRRSRSIPPAAASTDAGSVPERGSWRARPGSGWSDAGRLELGSRTDRGSEARSPGEARAAWPSGGERRRAQDLPTGLAPAHGSLPDRATFSLPAAQDGRRAAPTGQRTTVPAAPIRSTPAAPAASRGAERSAAPARGSRESEQRAP